MNFLAIVPPVLLTGRIFAELAVMILGIIESNILWTLVGFWRMFNVGIVQMLSYGGVTLLGGYWNYLWILIVMQ